PRFGAIYPDKSKIAALLSLDQVAIRPDLPVQVVSCGVPIVIIPISTLTEIGQAKVRLDLLEAYLKELESKVLYLFTQETALEASTVHSRFFAPTFGITEDPATGGASGPLGAYLVKYGLAPGPHMVNEQGIEMGRPSLLSIDIETSEGIITGVKVGGKSVAMGKGSLYLKVNALATTEAI
ncbi:MAG: PhzF family phenazine biosynthesis isomerase, partial [Bacteroidota bacterium]